jgi:protein-disulfide isomerase
MASNRSGGAASKKKVLRAERAAAALEERRRAERRRQLLTAAGVAVVLAVVVGGGYLIRSRGDDSTVPAASSPSSSVSIPPPGSQYGLTIGDASAPHQVVVYEDFLCPSCGELERASHEQLAAAAASGTVQIEYRPIVLLSQDGDYSTRSTLIWWLVHEKYGDEVAATFRDLLFAHQPGEQGPFPSRDDLYALAAQAGADAADLKAAVESNDGVQEVADATTYATKTLGIGSSPTVLLDGTPFTDGSDADDLAANLVEAVQ